MRTGMNHKTIAIALLILTACFAFLYRQIIVDLVYDWSRDDNYSHGFLIVPIALYLAYERRIRFASAERRPSNFGLVIVLGSLLLLFAGVLGAEYFTTRISMLGIIAGSLVFLFGWPQLRIMLFPVAFLLLMIPIPAMIFNQVALPLQSLASRFAEGALAACQVPVFREGNIINLANTSIEVAEACSGIRSLMALLALGIVYGYFVEARLWLRIALALATIPVAIAANALRVAGTGLAAHSYGASAAQGFFHTFSGWLVFLAALVMLFALHRILLLFHWARQAAATGRAPAENILG
jgi:exosortase